MNLKKALTALGLAFGLAVSPLADAPATARVPPEQNMAPGDRSISLYNTHTKEMLRVTYYRDGSYDEAALMRINRLLRDHRRDEAAHMSRDLVNLLHDIEQELERRHPGRDIVFHVISGYRAPATNDFLRSTRGGQASNSRHTHADAIDICVPGISLRELRDVAWCSQQGGVGYYPSRHSNFIHIDTWKARIQKDNFPGGSRYRAWGWTPVPGMCKNPGQ